jgi:hypothetical protein
MAAKTHEERIDRLEQVVGILAEDQLSLQKLIAELATETRKGFDKVAKQFAETDRRMRESDARVSDQMRETDARIDKLVVAIGNFISQKH